MNGEEIQIERHLYRRRYSTTQGESTIYFGRFTDWKGRRRKFALGNSLDVARDELGKLRMLDRGHHDWDAEKRKIEAERRRSMTFAQWGNRYFKDQLSPKDLRTSSIDREKRSFALLDNFFGDLSLEDINKARILDYRKRRKADGMEFSTVNRELSFLRKLLNVAADQDPPLIEKIPRFKLPGETSRARSQTIDAEEFAAILSHMKRPQQRYLIALHETSMRRNEPSKLKWDMVDLKTGLIRLPVEIVKEKYPRRTPISWELRQVLEELRTEQKTRQSWTISSCTT
jgi:integrase